MPVHRTAEHEARRNLLTAGGREIRGVDTGWDRASPRCRRNRGETSAIFLGDGNRQIGAAADLGLFVAHLAPLDREQQFFNRLRSNILSRCPIKYSTLFRKRNDSPSSPSR